MDDQPPTNDDDNQETKTGTKMTRARPKKDPHSSWSTSRFFLSPPPPPPCGVEGSVSLVTRLRIGRGVSGVVVASRDWRRGMSASRCSSPERGSFAFPGVDRGDILF